MNYIFKSFNQHKIVFIILTSVLVYFILGYASIHFVYNNNTYLSAETIHHIKNSNFTLFLKKPLLFIFAIIACFLIEAILLKGKSSSFYSIFNLNSPSARTDVFYMWIKVSGISYLLLNFIFLGFGFYLISIMQTRSLFSLDNYFLELLFMFIFGTFIQYWYHRLMHSKYFWELHKLHHSATEMNILTVAREHPLVVSVSILLLCLPAYIFGIHLEIIFIYSATTGIHNLFVHSKVNIIPRWLTFLLIDTKYHYLHHSTDTKHLNRNFGDLFNIWDKIFGTHTKPKINEEFTLGIGNDNHFNKDIYIREIFQVLSRWLKLKK